MPSLKILNLTYNELVKYDQHHRQLVDYLMCHVHVVPPLAVRRGPGAR